MKERQKGYANVRRLKTRAERDKPRGGRADLSNQAAETSLFAEFAEQHLQSLEARNLSESTLENRRRALDSFISWASQRGLSEPGEVTLQILEAYQRQVLRYRKANGKPLANRTIHKRISALQDYFRWLVRHGVLPANPASELILPKKESRLPEQALTLTQIDQLLAQPEVLDPLGIRDRAMLELLYATAIRRSELARLEAADLNREAATLRVRQGKGKKDRIVPVGGRALRWCERYAEEVRPKLIVAAEELTFFLTGYGGGFHPNALGYLIRKYCRAAGIEKGGAHLLRHTCATHLLEGGADIRYIQKLLGHASLETTAIYTEMSIESLRRVYSECHPAERRWKERGC